MGWKTSMIFVNSDKQFDLPELFADMGYYQLEPAGERVFDAVMNPDDDRIYVGRFNGNTIICMQKLPLESLEVSLSQAERVLSKASDHADVVTLCLHSVVNLWGYSVVRGRKKIRVRAGSSDGGTMVEYGDVLPEEQELMAQSKVDTSGDRVYILDGMPDDIFSEDQVGENYVFDISAKYFGESIDSSDELLETMFVGYTFSKSKPTVKAAPPEIEQTLEAPKVTTPENITPKVKKPWWKFW